MEGFPVLRTGNPLPSSSALADSAGTGLTPRTEPVGPSTSRFSDVPQAAALACGARNTERGNASSDLNSFKRSLPA
jgi:hypothetical protein